MQGIQGVEVDGHQPDGGKCGGNLAGHNAALAHAGDHQLGPPFGAPIQQAEGGLDLGAVEAGGCRRDGRGFFQETAGEGGQVEYSSFVSLYFLSQGEIERMPCFY